MHLEFEQIPEPRENEHLLPTAPLRKRREIEVSERFRDQRNESSSPVVDVGSQIHRSTDVVDELESSVAGRVLADSAVAVSVSVRERTFVSDTSTVVLLLRASKSSSATRPREKRYSSRNLHRSKYRQRHRWFEGREVRGKR